MGIKKLMVNLSVLALACSAMSILDSGLNAYGMMGEEENVYRIKASDAASSSGFCKENNWGMDDSVVDEEFLKEVASGKYSTKSEDSTTSKVDEEDIEIIRLAFDSGFNKKVLVDSIKDSIGSEAFNSYFYVTPDDDLGIYPSVTPQVISKVKDVLSSFNNQIYNSVAGTCYRSSSSDNVNGYNSDSAIVREGNTSSFDNNHYNTTSNSSDSYSVPFNSDFSGVLSNSFYEVPVLDNKPIDVKSNGALFSSKSEAPVLINDNNMTGSEYLSSFSCDRSLGGSNSSCVLSDSKGFCASQVNEVMNCDSGSSGCNKSVEDFAFNRNTSAGVVSIPEKNYLTGDREIDNWAKSHYNSSLYNSDISSLNQNTVSTLNRIDKPKNRISAAHDDEISKLDPSFVHDLEDAYDIIVRNPDRGASLASLLVSLLQNLKNTLSMKVNSTDFNEYRYWYDYAVGRFFSESDLERIANDKVVWNYGQGEALVEVIKGINDIFRGKDQSLNNTNSYSSPSTPSFVLEENDFVREVSPQSVNTKFKPISSSRLDLNRSKVKTSFNSDSTVDLKTNSVVDLTKRSDLIKVSPSKMSGSTIYKNLDVTNVKGVNEVKGDKSENLDNLVDSQDISLNFLKKYSKEDARFKGFDVVDSKVKKVARFKERSELRKKAAVRALRDSMYDAYKKLDGLFFGEGNSEVADFYSLLNTLKKVPVDYDDCLSRIKGLVFELNDAIDNYFSELNVDSDFYRANKRKSVSFIKTINKKLGSLGRSLNGLLSRKKVGNKKGGSYDRFKKDIDNFNGDIDKILA